VEGWVRDYRTGVFLVDRQRPVGTVILARHEPPIGRPNQIRMWISGRTGAPAATRTRDPRLRRPVVCDLQNVASFWRFLSDDRLWHSGYMLWGWLSPWL